MNPTETTTVVYALGVLIEYRGYSTYSTSLLTEDSVLKYLSRRSETSLEYLLTLNKC